MANAARVGRLGGPEEKPGTPAQQARAAREKPIAAPATQNSNAPVNGFLDQVTDTASQFAGIYDAIRPQKAAPAAPKPVTPQSNTGLFLGIGAGALVLVLVLVLALRK